MKTQHTFLCCLICTLCLCAPQIIAAKENAHSAAAKQAPTAQAPTWLLGAGASFTSTPYKDYSKWTPTPIIAYNSKYMYIRGTQGGVRFSPAEGISVKAFLEYDPTHFFGHHSGDKALEHLENRYGSLLAGVGGSLAMSFGGHLHASIATNVLNTHSGMVGTLEYNYIWRLEQLTLIPSVGVKILDADYINYYYGVRHSESARTGVSEYEVDDISIEPYASLRMSYAFTKNISASMGASVRILSSHVMDSPMVDDHKPVTYSLSGGIVYSF